MVKFNVSDDRGQGEVAILLAQEDGGVFLRGHTNDLKKELIGCALHMDG